jgi:hypothetical protein
VRLLTPNFTEGCKLWIGTRVSFHAHANIVLHTVQARLSSLPSSRTSAKAAIEATTTSSSSQAGSATGASTEQLTNNNISGHSQVGQGDAPSTTALVELPPLVLPYVLFLGIKLVKQCS